MADVCTPTSSGYMDVLTQIRKPVEREMKDFESLFGITLQHQNPLLMIALRHVLSRKGKLMRPILTLLAAKKYGEINDSVLHAAVSLEMFIRPVWCMMMW